MTNTELKRMYHATRDAERARQRRLREEANSFTRRVLLFIGGSAGALVVLVAATAALVTIDQHTGHQLAQWFPPQGCK